MPSEPETKDRRLRWAATLGLGLLGLVLNAVPMEILSGVHLLFGHGPVIAAAVLFGPGAAVVAGAIAGSVTVAIFDHPWGVGMLALEGAAVAVLARRLVPMRAAVVFWVGFALPYYLVLGSVYPAGTSAAVVVKSVLEATIGALILEVLLVWPRFYRMVRRWLPPPLREVSTGGAVRSVVLLAALLPLVLLVAVDTRLLYRERLEGLDRYNGSTAETLASTIEEEMAEARALLLETARELEHAPADRRRLLAGPLIQNSLLQEAALVRDGRAEEVVGVPRSDGVSLASVGRIPPGEPVRTLPVEGRPPLYLVAVGIDGGEIVASLDLRPVLGLVPVGDPSLTRLLLLGSDGGVVADTRPGDPLRPTFRAAIAGAEATGSGAYLPDPDVPRSLRPRTTQRLAIRTVASLGLRVVVVRKQALIQRSIEREALALLGGLGVAMIAVLAGSMVLTRLVVAPVRAVSRAALGLEEGRRTARVDPRAGEVPLELRQLAQGFDRMADRLERQLEAVEAASRAKDEFLSVASHELKTPLTILKAQVQLLARTAPEGQAPQLQRIDRQLDRLTRLISQLLDASAVGAGVIALAPQEVELSAVVRRVAEGLAPSAPGHDLRLDLEPVTGRWDELRLEQVFHNLLGNAIKFSPAGGPIDVVLRQQEDGGAVLEIADRGIGVATSDRSKVFQRFGRGTGTNIGGLGVGLYVVREIVERHGGTVELVPRDGGGTVATVRLPREGPAAPGR